MNDVTSPLPIILLVEDEQICADLVQDVFAKAHAMWTFQVVQTIREAMLALQTQDIALLLLDLNLPDLQGVLTLKAVLNAAPNIPIVVLTADEAQQGPCLAMGAIGFVGKSALMEQPLAVVQAVDVCYRHYHTIHAALNQLTTEGEGSGRE